VESRNAVPLHCGFFIIVLDLRLTKIGLGNSGEFPFSLCILHEFRDHRQKPVFPDFVTGTPYSKTGHKIAEQVAYAY